MGSGRTLEVRVYGQPRPKGSHAPGRGGGFRPASPHLKAWQGAVTEAARASVGASQGGGLVGAVGVRLRFSMPRPDSHWTTRGALKPWAEHMRYVVVAPDLDKLARAVLDGLDGAGWFTDDSQVALIQAEKRYSDQQDRLDVGVGALAWEV